MAENTKTGMMTMKQYQDRLMTDVLGDLNVNTQRGIVYPRNYIPQNALMNAVLALAQAVDKNGTPVLQACSAESVKQAILDMLQKGLNVGKNQGYFIAYGKKLTWFTSYFGHICQAMASDPNIKDIFAEVVYQDDVFKYQIKAGKKIVTEHSQDPDNIDTKKIKGAYATILYRDGSEVSEYMTFDQIKRSWSFGQTKGGSSAHRETPEEMSKRTVVNRLTKPIINSADDSSMIDIVNEIDREADQNEGTVMLDITPSNEDAQTVEVEEQEVEQEDEKPEPPKAAPPKAEPVKTGTKAAPKQEAVDELPLPEAPPDPFADEDQQQFPF